MRCSTFGILEDMMHFIPLSLDLTSALFGIYLRSPELFSGTYSTDNYNVRKRKLKSPIIHSRPSVSPNQVSLSPNTAHFRHARLMKEYKDLTNDEDPSFTAGPIREDDFFEWEALITGPEGTPFVSNRSQLRWDIAELLVLGNVGRRYLRSQVDIRESASFSYLQLD
jgi:hypothetical protein